MNEICFWSIGDGIYSGLVQTLVNSFHHVKMEGHFHAFTDKPVLGAETHIIPSFNKENYLFKLNILQSEVKKLNYKYFVFLDADTIFVRKPPNLLDLMQGSPVHMFLEHDFSKPTFRPSWAKYPRIDIFPIMMKEEGVTSNKIYNVNAGFFILERDIIDRFCELALSFWEKGSKKGFKLTEEPGMAYATHMLCPNLEAHLHRKYYDIWMTDWAGQFLDRYPDGINWIYWDYMTLSTCPVNPAIIHVPKSKRYLIQLADYLAKKKDPR